jgi:hypothetical protein
MPHPQTIRTARTGTSRAAPHRASSTAPPAPSSGNTANASTRNESPHVSTERNEGFVAKNSHSMPTKKETANG